MRLSHELQELLSRQAKLLTASALLSLVLAALFFAASYASLGRGGHERVIEAFNDGVLTVNQSWDEVRGRHQHNDCLILGLALEQNSSPLELSVSPRQPFGPSESVCQDLYENKFITDKQFYHQYVHGHTVMARYLLSYLSVQSIRELYKALSSISLLFGISFCLLRLMRREEVEDNLVLLICLLGLARFFGLEWFGQSLSHGPADLVLIGFVVATAMLRGRLRVPGWVLLTSVFGVLTIVFEFLTGGLPLGASAVIGLGWFVLSPAVRSAKNVLLGLASFATAVATVIGAKLVLVAWIFGNDAVLAVVAQGGLRMHGPLPDELSHLNALHQVIVSLGVLSPGLPLLSIGMLLLSLGAAAKCALRCPEPPVLLLLASCLPIFGWFLIFQQHSAIHAWFMARILVWPMIAGFAVVAWSIVRQTQASRGILRAPSTDLPCSS